MALKRSLIWMLCGAVCGALAGALAASVTATVLVGTTYMHNGALDALLSLGVTVLYGLSFGWLPGALAGGVAFLLLSLQRVAGQERDARRLNGLLRIVSLSIIWGTPLLSLVLVVFRPWVWRVFPVWGQWVHRDAFLAIIDARYFLVAIAATIGAIWASRVFSSAKAEVDPVPIARP